MVAHCLYRAKFCKKIDLLILATPDKEIYELGKKLGFEVCVTSHDHERATERAGEVVEILKGQKKYFDNKGIDYDYVDCEVNPKECPENIVSYPTTKVNSNTYEGYKEIDIED